ncbi:MAG: MTH938/NDUFAF3 family protein [Blastomonas sp.]
MELRREEAASGPVITGLGPRGYRLRDRHVDGGLLLTPVEAVEWNAAALDRVSLDDLRPLLDLSPIAEFILLGTGAQLVHPPRALVLAVEDAGSGIEAMDSRAAARAWAVLRSEGRWIAAALLPIGAR